MSDIKKILSRGDSRTGKYIITVENLPVWDYKQVGENRIRLIHPEDYIPEEECITLEELKRILIDLLIPFSKVIFESEEFSTELASITVFENSKKVNLSI